MQRTVVCKGDRTTHGGTVIEGDALRTINGRAIATLGCMTTCPQCRGNFPIIEGARFHTICGYGTVLDGMETGCGARVIASPDTIVTVDDPGGTSDDAGGTHLNSQAPKDTLSTQFQVVDEQTGKPIVGKPYQIMLPDGSSQRGVTDAEGKTVRITGQDPATVELHWDVETLDGRLGQP
jgi:uncharacterized Zn-binding protein involved in type VI secretion